MPGDDLLLCFEEEAETAGRIADAVGVPLERISRHRFPDGEMKVRLPESLPARVVVYRSLDHPDEKLVELLFAAWTARTLGADHLTLVAPYLGYMRQDKAFLPGEAISQRIFGQFLADLFDALVTVDPHLHRIACLQEAVPVRDVEVLSGAPLLAGLIAERRKAPILIGPDAESAQWVAEAARVHGFDHAVCSKRRFNDREVEITLPGIDVEGREVVLIDDVASTGNTVARAASLLLVAGASSVDLAVTHALFVGDALDHVRAAGVAEIWSTDTIPHPSNAVSIARPVADALARLAERGG